MTVIDNFICDSRCRRKLPAGNPRIINDAIIMIIILLVTIRAVEMAIIPPAWADPERNPCASLPGGWQLLYWAPLRRCFKIFNLGYPCPETMELSPALQPRRDNSMNSKQHRDMIKVNKTISHSDLKSSLNNPGFMPVTAVPLAECRCPPGTALHLSDNKCYKIFEMGPCKQNQYFSPLSQESAITVSSNAASKSQVNQRFGSCKAIQNCSKGLVFWPMDGECYRELRRGPCAKGKLLLGNSEGIGQCRCENQGRIKPFYHELTETCHEPYTRGPCSTPGHLFLPGGRCDCHRLLPHYHADHEMCYELGTRGPCPAGHVYRFVDHFRINDLLQEHEQHLTQKRGNPFQYAQCECKEGYVPWSDGLCYRLYTQGPCAANEFVVNVNTCDKNQCSKNQLYFPDQQQCYRVGTRGPCSSHQVVVFDFTARPSVDGISYNGLCGCAGIIHSLDQQCSSDADQSKIKSCESTPGMAEFEGKCYKLYTRGPCGPGQWLRPSLDDLRPRWKCSCRPGFSTIGNETMWLPSENVLQPQRCNAPTVNLARYLTESITWQRHRQSFNINN